jgi:hypothetical protein
MYGKLGNVQKHGTQSSGGNTSTTVISLFSSAGLGNSEAAMRIANSFAGFLLFWCW